MPETSEIIAALLRQRTPVSFRAGGPSMHPTVRDGEVVAVRPRPPGAIRRGSVVLYQIHGRLVLHRYTFNDNRTNRLFTVGDAAVDGGEWIPEADVLGLAAGVCRNGKTIRLDTAGRRLAGLVRFALRPGRRALWNFRQSHHAQTPARRDG